MLNERRRVMVIGSGGAGKSTFACRLAAATFLPLVHLDQHYWRPGWERPPTEEWHAVVERLAAQVEWIIDGNYTNSLSIRTERCDAIVFFDFHRLVCLRGVLKRRLTARFGARPDAAEGCPERLNWDFLKWVWEYDKISRPSVVAAIDEAEHAEVLTVRNRADTDALIRKVEARAAQLATAPDRASPSRGGGTTSGDGRDLGG